MIWNGQSLQIILPLLYLTCRNWFWLWSKIVRLGRAITFMEDLQEKHKMSVLIWWLMVCNDKVEEMCCGIRNEISCWFYGKRLFRFWSILIEQGRIFTLCLFLSFFYQPQSHFSIYWDYALTVPLRQIVCIHCHQRRESPSYTFGILF